MEHHLTLLEMLGKKIGKDMLALVLYDDESGRVVDNTPGNVEIDSPAHVLFTFQDLEGFREKATQLILGSSLKETVRALIQEELEKREGDHK